MRKCECGNKIDSAPGVGDYCTNIKCPIEERRFKGWRERRTSTKSKWIKFVLSDLKPKTKVWTVITKDHALPIGQIQWLGKWRKYAFFPLAETVFEPNCLRDIAEFIEDKMEERKQ